MPQKKRQNSDTEKPIPKYMLLLNLKDEERSEGYSRTKECNHAQGLKSTLIPSLTLACSNRRQPRDIAKLRGQKNETQ